MKPTNLRGALMYTKLANVFSIDPNWDYLPAPYPPGDKTDLLARIIDVFPEETLLYLTHEPVGICVARMERFPNVYDKLTVVLAKEMTAEEIINRIVNDKAKVVFVETGNHVFFDPEMITRPYSEKFFDLSLILIHRSLRPQDGEDENLCSRDLRVSQLH